MNTTDTVEIRPKSTQQAEIIARNRFKLANNLESEVSMPLFLLIDLIQQGIDSVERKSTRTTQFFAYNEFDATLFSVQSGISAEDALNQLSCFLSVALDMSYQTEPDDKESRYKVQSISCMLEFSVGLLRSVMVGK